MTQCRASGHWVSTVTCNLDVITFHVRVRFSNGFADYEIYRFLKSWVGFRQSNDEVCPVLCDEQYLHCNLMTVRCLHNPLN